jgi:flagellar biosynthesis anti-sigma factor FlgM
MDVRDRSTYPSIVDNTAIDAVSRPRNDGQSTPDSVSASPAHDSSDFSQTAQLVQHVMQSPDIRQDRIASLQQQIASGSYQIAPIDVAGAMIRNLRG